MRLMETFCPRKFRSGILTIRSLSCLVCSNDDSSSSSSRRFIVRNARRRNSGLVARGSLEQLSMNVVLNAGSAAMSKGGVSAMHSAVASTVKDVFITAIAIASGACLSTKVDFLWPKGEHLPERVELEGVDITGYNIFNEAMVQKAVAFAKNAHMGQMRKTGEPYLSHCINTGKILAAIVPASGEWAVNTIVAGIIHDVMDDAGESLNNIEQEFGSDVASLVASVSKLSFINQVLRRHRRTNARFDVLRSSASTEVNDLRTMLLGMVNDPRVVLIKLADRLHNMRTIYALPREKAQCLAQETLAVWCPLASRLGVWAVKAELEDLCFAVLQPKLFRHLRARLASMWSCEMEQRPFRKGMKSARRKSNIQTSISLSHNKVELCDDNESNIKELIQAVIPFELLLDRGKRSHFLKAHENRRYCKGEKPKVVCDAETALASLVTCEEALEKELLISTSYIPGMEVTLSGRLKSLYSTYSKMKRKGVALENIYDARALRVIVGDDGGKMHAAAVECCYNLLNVVHSLWTPLDGEFDDYIVNPKTSGYQSLHTSVQGSDGSPLEVQIRTQSMHQYAEFGHAAHWLYKETPVVKRVMPLFSNENKNVLQTEDSHNTSFNQSQEEDNEHLFNLKFSSIRAGHPAVRIEDSRLFAAVILRVDNSGRELLVAVNFSLAASQTLHSGRMHQRRRWELYARLYKKASEKWWCAPGHGDWNTCLEKYVLCQDGIYHKQDQFQRLLPTSIHPINFSKEEEREEYWDVMAAICEGKEISTNSALLDRSICVETINDPKTVQLNNKVRFLRSMLRWEEELQQEALFHMCNRGVSPQNHESLTRTEIAVILWPNVQIMQLPLGSTASDAARRLGLIGHFVLVNGHLVPSNTELNDGDIVEVRP